MVYPDADKRGRGNKGKAAETVDFSQKRLSQARAVLKHSRALAESRPSSQKPGNFTPDPFVWFTIQARFNQGSFARYVWSRLIELALRLRCHRRFPFCDPRFLLPESFSRGLYRRGWGRLLHINVEASSTPCRRPKRIHPTWKSHEAALRVPIWRFWVAGLRPLP
jgi:hypothetical protein